MLDVRYGGADVEHREHDEDERLQERDQQLEREQEEAGERDQQSRPRQAEQDGAQGAGQHPADHAHREQEHHRQQDVPTRHVAEQSKRQRERSGQVAEDLDDEEERHQDDLEGQVDRLVREELRSQQRPREVLEVRQQPHLARADHVIRDEHDQGAGGRGVEVAGGRDQAGDQPQQVGDENEQAERRDQRQVAAAVVTDDVVEQRLELLDHDLHEVLDAAGHELQLPGGGD